LRTVINLFVDGILQEEAELHCLVRIPFGFQMNRYFDGIGHFALRFCLRFSLQQQAQRNAIRKDQEQKHAVSFSWCSQFFIPFCKHQTPDCYH
jgi:hypothetical protein